MSKSRVNVLYLTVLPLLHFNKFSGLGGSTDQAMTLFPSRQMATEFFPDEVDQYLNELKTRARDYLVGGHVKGYEFQKVVIHDDRVIVRVLQHVE
jgi:hypothetical protein